MYGPPGQQQPPQQQQAQQDLSVVLVTGSYDHEIRFWEAWSGICSRTIARSGETGVSNSSSLDQGSLSMQPLPCYGDTCARKLHLWP